MTALLPTRFSVLALTQEQPCRLQTTRLFADGHTDSEARRKLLVIESKRAPAVRLAMSTFAPVNQTTGKLCREQGGKDADDK